MGKNVNGKEQIGGGDKIAWTKGALAERPMNSQIIYKRTASSKRDLNFTRWIMFFFFSSHLLSLWLCLFNLYPN